MDAIVDVIVIPEGVRLHLWDSKSKSISDAYFYSTGPLNVIIKKGHGPMYKLLQEIPYRGDISHQLDKTDFTQLWDDTKEVAKEIPLLRNLVKEDRVFNIASELSTIYDDIDAIYMAYTNDGKIALQFIHPGNTINPMDLQ